ncbi:hypothetical protein DVH05_002601 [Phytophthora capsici]|nr:hypothetical protein DVH05_002601 [Phytophthora capsici]
MIHLDDVVNAKEDLVARLELPAPSVDEDGDAYWGPSIVCAAITWEHFERWLIVNEGLLKRWDYEPLNDGTNRGRVAIYTLPWTVDEDTSHTVVQSIFKQIMIAGNDIDLIDTVIGGQRTSWTGDRGQEPNASFTPRNLTVGGEVLAAAHNTPFPNVIIEVAHKNRSLRMLRAKLQRWMSNDTSVRVAIGIKIFYGPVTSRRVAILHQRGQLTQEVEFGFDYPPPPPLTFPLGAIYTGVALPQSLGGLENHLISIDLVGLRNVINARVQRELDS